jgi:regulator of replication initiation timing
VPEETPSQAAIAVLSSVDLPGLGDQLLGRVVERELRARLPGLRVTQFAPLGWDRPSVTDGGLVARPLAGPQRTTAARIVESGSLSVVCPAFPLGDALEARYLSPRAQWAEPYFTGGLGEKIEADHLDHLIVLFGVRVIAQPPKDLVDAANRHPLVAVRDKVSQERLRAAGVTREIVVVPHPAFALDNVVDVDGLLVRAAGLEPLGMLPNAGYAVVPESVEPLVRGLVGDEQMVTLPGHAVFEDKLAILRKARFVIAADEHTAAAAAGLGVPWVLFDPTGEETAPVLEFGHARQVVASPAELPDALVAARELPSGKEKVLEVLADHFDRLAELVTGGVEPRPRVAELVEENRALRHANVRLRERMAVERRRMIDPIASLVRQSDELAEQLAVEQAVRADLARRNEELAAAVAERDRQLVAWENIRLVRWTNPIRRAYGKVRSLVK